MINKNTKYPVIRFFSLPVGLVLENGIMGEEGVYILRKLEFFVKRKTKALIYIKVKQFKCKNIQ
jgi:hypothetical protein